MKIALLGGILLTTLVACSDRTEDANVHEEIEYKSENLIKRNDSLTVKILNREAEDNKLNSDSIKGDKTHLKQEQVEIAVEPEETIDPTKPDRPK